MSPPDEVLKKGTKKFKTCLIGMFPKATLLFHKVALFAHSIWDGKGLLNVSQKDKRTFIFKFDSVVNMNFALARGTWYVENKPMIVHTWGTNVGKETSMPLWVKFENMPDNY